MPKALAPKPVQAFLFGTFTLVGGAGPIYLPTHRIESLLAYLLLHPEPHTREKLATLIWGEANDMRARNSLRNALALLRKKFGADLLLVDREQVQLNPRYPFRVDALAFREQAEHFLSALSPAPEQVDVSLYRGELLQDFYDEWIAPEREQYRALQLDTLLRLAQLMRARSAYPQAIAVAQRVLAFDAANERAHQHLMFCYLATGQRRDALKQFEECRRLLRSELGVEPAAETLALHEWIKQNSGESRSPSARITNLPIPLSSFIGREREMAQVKLLLQRGRLVTLSGTGGSGKTRLAVQVATDLVDAFEDGVWWVDLAPLSDETLVTHAVANALGVQERLGQPLVQTLLEALRSRRLLLLLDNCEHLIAACAQLAEMLLGACSRLHVLATSREPLNIGGEAVWQVPMLSLPQVPARSAHPLSHVQSDAGHERSAAAPTLAQDIEQSEAVRLFVERATAVNADFALSDAAAPAVAQICRRLDGIPLAIELAAARAKVFSPEEIAARLDDRFNLLTQNSRSALPRQQTLRALIDWSYDLLSEPERVLFRRLAVFNGGRTLDAVLAVCTEERIAQDGILDLLTHLVDKSLLQVTQAYGQTRYRFLETVRQYAVERLNESDEAERLRERHLAYFMALAEAGSEKLRGEEQVLWLNRLEAEHDNLRAALAWARARGDHALALQLAGALWLFWYLHGDWIEGRYWLDALLADFERARGTLVDDEQVPVPLTGLLARALHGAGQLAENQGELAPASRMLQHSVRLWRRLADGRGLARALNGFGEVSFSMGDYRSAQANFEESLMIWRQQGYAHGIAVVLCNLSQVRLLQGAYQEAHALAHEALHIWQARDDRRGVVDALVMQARSALARGAYEQAQAWFAECLPIQRELRMKSKLAETLNGLALVARGRADYAGSRELSRQSLAVSREMAGRFDTGWSLHNLACVELHGGNLAEALDCRRESLRLFVAANSPLGIALGCLSAAQDAVECRQAERAMRLLGGAQAVLARMGARLGEPDRSEAEQSLAAARALLSAEQLAAAWSEGELASLESLVADALT